MRGCAVPFFSSFALGSFPLNSASRNYFTLQRMTKRMDTGLATGHTAGKGQDQGEPHAFKFGTEAISSEIVSVY
jgi:hypothetical protein